MGRSFQTAHERFDAPVTMRVPHALRATVEALARKMGVGNSEAFRRLIAAGLEMEDARRSWRVEGDLVAYVNDLRDRDPQNAHGSWKWMLDDDGPSPAFPHWVHELEKEPFTPPAAGATEELR